MKIIKRNAVIITVLMFVCAAVYLNWSYKNRDEEVLNPDQTDSTAVSAPEELTGAELYYTAPEEPEQTVSEYFASVRLARQQAKSEAQETLSDVSEAETASQETIDESLRKIMVMADRTMKEAEIESLVISKGFEECVVFISDDGVKVTVPAPADGLSNAAVARITEIVESETEFNAQELSIIEIK